MYVNSKFTDLINTVFSFTAKKLNSIWSESFFAKIINKLIYCSIILLFSISLFAPTEIIGFIAFGVVILTIISLIFDKEKSLILTKWDSFLVAFILFGLVCVFNSHLISYSFKGYSKYLTYFLTYFSFFQYFRYNTEKIKPTILLLLIFSTVESLIAIYQNYFDFMQISTWQDTSYLNPEEVLSRAYGTLKPYNPNLLSGYLLCIFPLFGIFIADFLTKKNYKLLAFCVIGVLLNILAIFYTGSRSAYLGIITFFIILFTILYNWVKKNPRFQKAFKVFCVSCTSFVILVIACSPSILKRLLSIFILRDDSSTSFRLNVYHSAVQMFGDNFLFGIGLGNEAYRQIYGLYMISGFDALSTYNVSLELLVETGLIGFILYSGFLITLSIYAIKFLKQQNDFSKKIIVSAILCSFLVTFVQGFFDTVIFRPQVLFVFLFIAAAVSSIIIEKKEN